MGSEKVSGYLTLNALFLGQGTREAVHEGYADYTPCFLSEIPSLFHDKTLPIDVALISVIPPDPMATVRWVYWSMSCTRLPEAPVM
ncbi:MAG: hypothetical protein VX208_00835 [SAR324 cluster bacterium]|nr:hypothetical protein [SAR324 cluster bacterium]